MAERRDVRDVAQGAEQRLWRKAGNHRFGESQDRQDANEAAVVVDHAGDPRRGMRRDLVERGEDVGFAAQQERLDLEQALALGDRCVTRRRILLGHVLRPSSAATTDDVGRRLTFLDS